MRIYLHLVICRCQKAVLDELELGQNIARNTALSENVFMMVVCIELRIPLFVVGKPGSSKSLAKTVVADNMEGAKSKSDLFKTFKEVKCTMGPGALSIKGITVSVVTSSKYAWQNPLLSFIDNLPSISIDIGHVDVRS